MVEITWDARVTETRVAGGDEITETAGGNLICDGTAAEQYGSEAMATEHPVEDGAPITDHVRPGLRRLLLDVIVSAHPGPTSTVQGDASFDPDAAASRPAYARETLARLLDEGAEVTVDTPTGSWESMLILRIDEQRSPETGDSYRAQITLREIRRVATIEVEAPAPRVERGRRRADRGDQTAAGESGSAAPEPSRRSLALALLQQADPATWGRGSP